MSRETALRALRPSRARLRTEDQIQAGWRDAQAEPVVSICCATFNHAPWIEDAICGFLAQETQFRFEVIIRDDASSDGTREIVAQYAAKYPGIIRPILNEQNDFDGGEGPLRLWREVAKGRYYALCEGDDFWVSPNKIEVQTSWMERNPEYALSCHDSYNASGRLIARPRELLRQHGDSGAEFDTDGLLTRNLVTSNTVFFRAEYLKTFPRSGLLMLDWPLWLHLSLHGRCFYHYGIYGCYRDHGIGMWTRLPVHQRVHRELEFYDFLARAYPDLGERVERKRKEHISRVLLDYQGRLDELAELRRNPLKYLASRAWRRLASKIRKMHAGFP